MSDQHAELLSEGGRIVAKTLPGAAATAGTAMTGEAALSLIVGVLTVVFLILQIAHLVWKWRRDLQTREVQP